MVEQLVKQSNRTGLNGNFSIADLISQKALFAVTQS